MSSISSDKEQSSGTLENVHKVRTSGKGDEFVILGDKTYYRHELMAAFAGTLRPEHYSAPPKRGFGNASALGLASFSLATFLLGLYELRVKGITNTNMVTSAGIFYGGFVEGCCGIWEMFQGNTFAATMLMSYGFGFWISFGCMQVPAFGMLAAYAEDPKQGANAIGFFLLGWVVFTTMVVLLLLKSTYLLLLLFVLIDLCFVTLAAYYFTGRVVVVKALGGLLVAVAVLGWYCSLSGMAVPQNSYYQLPVLPIPVKRRE